MRFWRIVTKWDTGLYQSFVFSPTRPEPTVEVEEVNLPAPEVPSEQEDYHDYEDYGDDE